MEWLTCIRKAIDFMEDNLQNDISVQDIAGQVYVSPYFLQKGFSLMTGYGIGEYLRSRRLSQAAMDLLTTEDKVIDIAMRYTYDTPESFTKAFSRFHGASPSQVRSGQSPARSFLPLKISIVIQGGNTMDCKITKMSSLKLIGFQREFTYEEAYAEIPKFWGELTQKYFSGLWQGKAPSDPCEKAIADNCIGEFAVNIDDIGGGKFRYLVAGRYKGGEVPEGMVLHEFPEGEWAVFDCVGKMPEVMQTVNTKVFKEWLPGNPDYELSGNANVEWYENKDISAPDYHSAIWLPVRKKNS